MRAPKDQSEPTHVNGDPRIGCILTRVLEQARIQRAARGGFWEVCDEAINSEDYKVHSTLPEWRERALLRHAAVFEAVASSDRPLHQAARLLRSCEPDRACRNINPSAVATNLQYP